VARIMNSKTFCFDERFGAWVMALGQHKRSGMEKMDKHVAAGEPTNTPQEDAVEALRRRLGRLDPRQIAAWQAMSPARRLEIAFQAYQFALDAVRLTERQNHPHLSAEELAWRVTRRLQGNYRLGR
jgi:hypothetical protein